MIKVKIAWGWAVRTARLMVGVPDYDNYVAHRKAHHPEEPIMTYVDSSANARTRVTPSKKAVSKAAADDVWDEIRSALSRSAPSRWSQRICVPSRAI